MQHLRNLDKSKKFVVSNQLPMELAERKKRLLPTFHEAKKSGVPVKWIGEKLKVNDKLVEIVSNETVLCIDGAEEAATKVKMRHAPPKTYNKSVFQGHICNINSQDDIAPSLFSLYTDTRVARATHNIYAYITTNEQGDIIEHCEDDGEWGSGRKLLEMMKKNGIKNKLIIVTRWYGGVHLGPKRFDYVLEAATSANKMGPIE